MYGFIYTSTRTRPRPFVFYSIASTHKTPTRFQRKNTIKAPAAACKIAKRIFTVLTGSFPSSHAPKTPPAVTPSEVGISTEKEYNPFQAYRKKDNKDTGRINKIAVACASFSASPVLCSIGTAIIPPPPPNKPFAKPTAPPQTIAPANPLFSSIFTLLPFDFPVYTIYNV